MLARPRRIASTARSHSCKRSSTAAATNLVWGQGFRVWGVGWSRFHAVHDSTQNGGGSASGSGEQHLWRNPNPINPCTLNPFPLPDSIHSPGGNRNPKPETGPVVVLPQKRAPRPPPSDRDNPSGRLNQCTLEPEPPLPGGLSGAGWFLSQLQVFGEVDPF